MSLNYIPNILIVDDNPPNLVYLETILRDLNVSIIKAFSGAEALSKIEGQELAVAVIDLQMPEMSGFELAQLIKSQKRSHLVPIIFLTAYYNDKEHIFKGYETGAVDFLIKPIGKTILLSKIKIFLELDRQKHQILNHKLKLKKTIIELRLIKESLSDSEEKFRVLYNNSPDMYASVSPDDDSILLCNNTFLNKTGYSGKEIIGSPIFKMYHDDCMDEVKKAFQQFVETGVIQDKELIVKRKDGSKIDVSLNVEAVRNEAGKILYSISSCRDISERKQTENALKESEEMYRTLLNTSPDGIVITDLKGLITEASNIALELFGTDSNSDLIGKRFLKFIPKESLEKAKAIFSKTLIEGLIQNIELNLSKKDQSQFIGEISTTLIQDPDGKPRAYMAIIRDISHRKKMEKQLLHSERMAGVGEMAAGIAHEINQPLNTISLTMDNILHFVNNNNIDKKYLKNKSDKIFDNITRMRNIIDHVRTFSRDQDKFILSEFNINKSITNGISLVSEKFKHIGIHIILRLNKSIPNLIGNTDKFEQVILNILINAKDAIEEKRQKLKKEFRKTIEIKTYQENNNTYVEIKDNGIGIKPEDDGNIMLPFYTTKRAGKGTGLGLSISYGIIKEMNGDIEIYSEVLNWTLVKIIIPI